MSTKTVIVGDEAQLQAALQAATGDTAIRLQAGVYDRVYIKDINPEGRITIVSDVGQSATINYLSVHDSSNLTFKSVKFKHDAGSATTTLQASIFGSTDITFLKVDVSSVVDNNFTNDASGIRITGSERVSVLDSRFHDLRTAIYTERSEDIVIAGNDTRKVREGFDFTDVENVTIDRNLFTDFRPMLSGTKPDHPDGIQFWTSASTGSENVEITNNAFLFGNAVPIQGIFIRSELGDVARHSDFVIANNVYQGQSRHGITVYDADGVRITGNTVVSAPKTGTAAYLDPAINTRNTTGTEVDHNISALMFSTGDTGLSAHHNIDAWDTSGFGGISALELFGRTPTATAKPDTFLVRTGSAADLQDIGYAHVDKTGNWYGVTDFWLTKYATVLDDAGSAYQLV